MTSCLHKIPTSLRSNCSHGHKECLHKCMYLKFMVFTLSDTASLLRFLRTSKFSQLRARSMIEGYLSLKIEQPFYYNYWDPCGKDVAKFFKAGYVHLPLTHTDTHYYE